MTRINFRIEDFQGVLIPEGTIPELVFRPSAPAVDAWGTYFGEVRVSGTATGVDLVPTVAMHGDVHYTLELSWLEGGIARRAEWPYKIRVPEGGPVELFEVVDRQVHELYQPVEVSAGTTDLNGMPVPHYAGTEIWLKLGTNGGIYMESE